MNSRSITLEICTDSASGAAAAEAGGAQRVELCSALSLGGLTPSAGCIEQAVAATTLPIMVMIRPRPGDFCYDRSELATMAADIDRAAELGAKGVVFGVLSPDGTLDTEAIARLAERSRPLAVVVHRAIDVTVNPVASIESLAALDVDRVLSSGGAPTAPLGAETLARMIQAANGRLVVMPGGGVRERHVAALLAATGARELHVTAGVVCDGPMEFREAQVSMASAHPPGEFERKTTYSDRVAAFVKTTRAMNL
ncbi:MAG: copper homeostasis protein [Pseudohongiellaceae bacterium]